ncbi:MAG: hypothetical protein MUF15_01935 [Acidobacteria bacterium]|nr:hypothetical protein [Acidobacteriota bacterium]
MILDSRAAQFISAEGLGIKIEDGTFSEPVMVGLYKETDAQVLAPMAEGFQRLSALRVDFLSPKAYGCGGGGDSLFGTQAKKTPEFSKFLVETEGLKQSKHFMAQWLTYEKPYAPPFPLRVRKLRKNNTLFIRRALDIFPSLWYL